jgi:ABC-type polysaccharide/polyol phosphate export permease
MKRRVLQLFIHLMATVGLFVLGFIAASSYERVFGVPPSRGIAVGISMELVVMVHLLSNLAIALVPQLPLKAAGVGIFIATTLYLLLPLHPVRAAFMAVAGTLCSILAILFCSRVARRKPASSQA